MKKSTTLAGTAFASTPGTIMVNRLKWTICYPKWVCIWTFSLMASITLALLHGWGWWLLVIPLLRLNWFYWARVRDHFAHGDVCPAMVVSLKPLLLAVGTDLAKGFTCCPAIKVIQAPTCSIPAKERVVGQRLATVALYSGLKPDAPHWDHFDPRPVGAATMRKAVRQQTFERISDELWRNFDSWLAQAPKLQPGLHIIASPELNSNDAQAPLSINEIMQAYAADAVAYAKNKFGIVLDYSEQSLVEVDALLSAMTSHGLLTKDELSKEQQDDIWTLCKVIGGYVGAVIIKHLGGHWETDTGSDGATNIKLKIANRLTASPPEKIWKRLNESEADMIIGYYRGLQHILGLKLFAPKDLKRAFGEQGDGADQQPTI